MGFARFTHAKRQIDSSIRTCQRSLVEVLRRLYIYELREVRRNHSWTVVFSTLLQAKCLLLLKHEPVALTPGIPLGLTSPWPMAGLPPSSRMAELFFQSDRSRPGPSCGDGGLSLLTFLPGLNYQMLPKHSTILVSTCLT